MPPIYGIVFCDPLHHPINLMKLRNVNVCNIQLVFLAETSKYRAFMVRSEFRNNHDLFLLIKYEITISSLAQFWTKVSFVMCPLGNVSLGKHNLARYVQYNAYLHMNSIGI